MSDNTPVETPENTLQEGEPHPSAHSAFVWFNKMVVADPIRYVQFREAIASTALAGNRLASLCNSTLDRLEQGQPVSDRYLLGLCWFLRDMIERTQYETPTTTTSDDKGSDGKELPSNSDPKVDEHQGQVRESEVRPDDGTDTGRNK